MSNSTIDPEIQTLVDRARSGDGEAFAALYDRYVNVVYAYILRRVRSRDLAEDLTSDVFLRALGSIERFTWRGVDIGAWLMTIARNRVTDHFKSARSRLERTTDAVDDGPTPDPRDRPEERVIEHELRIGLEGAMRLLSPDHREILELRFKGGLSVAESAAAMERTEGAIKALQYRALRALAQIVKADPRLGVER